MDSVNKLKTMMGLQALMQEFDAIFDKFSEESKKKFVSKSEEFGGTAFEAKILNAYKDSVGESTFNAIVNSPAFKDLFSQFRTQRIKEALTDFFNFFNEEAKRQQIEHELTAEGFIAIVAVTGQLRQQGFEKFWEGM